MSDLKKLKEEVYKANMLLKESGLVVLTWGNASAVDREAGVIVIKPSGVDYDKLTPEDMVVVDMDGNVVEGALRPSSDTHTHLELYRSFPEIGGVVHTHSTYATAFAQAKRPLTPYGTTHADCFYGEVPVTRELEKAELAAYEANTGKVIAERFAELDYNAVPAVLVASHGPFTWGSSALKAAENAITLEEVAKMAAITSVLNPDVTPLDQAIADKHYFRKHGAGAYYGQGGNK